MPRKLIKRSPSAPRPLASGTTALYIRVSTAKQADEGYSLDDQRQRLAAYCTAQGWPVNEDHIYTDAGESAKTAQRPAFAALLSAAQAGHVRRIVALKLDRVARNVKDFLALVDELNRLAVDLVLIKESFDTSTPHGKFALTMFAAMAELEAATITERVMSGKAQKAEQGGFNGAPAPLGYDYQAGQFTPNQHARTIRQIFSQFIDGAGLSEIAQTLNANRVPTATGRHWYAGTVRYVLTNGFYAGLTQWNNLEADGAQPPIIDRATYEAAHRRLLSLKPGPAPNDH